MIKFHEGAFHTALGSYSLMPNDSSDDCKTLPRIQRCLASPPTLYGTAPHGPTLSSVSQRTTPHKHYHSNCHFCSYSGSCRILLRAPDRHSSHTACLDPNGGSTLPRGFVCLQHLGGQQKPTPERAYRSWTTQRSFCFSHSSPLPHKATPLT